MTTKSAIFIISLAVGDETILFSFELLLCAEFYHNRLTESS